MISKHSNFVGLFLAAVAVLTWVGCSSHRVKYRIEGHIEGLSGPVVLMSEFEDFQYADVIDGNFRLEGKLDSQDVLMLGDEDGNPFALVFIEGGKLWASGDYETRSIEISGSPLNDRYYAAAKQMSLFRKRLSEYDADSEEMQAALSQIDSMKFGLFEKNRDNLLGAYILLNGLVGNMTIEELEEALFYFPPELSEQRLIVEVHDLLERRKRTEIGRPYTDVSLPDSHGKMVSVSDLLNPDRVVLIEFWASWAKPYMRMLPRLVKTYELFHEQGLDIYGISLDVNREMWQQAIEENEAFWTQVATFAGMPNPAIEYYDINGIPVNFLISGEGIIIARNLYGERLDEELAKLLGRPEE